MNHCRTSNSVYPLTGRPPVSKGYDITRKVEILLSLMKRPAKNIRNVMALVASLPDSHTNAALPPFSAKSAPLITATETM